MKSYKLFIYYISFGILLFTITQNCSSQPSAGKEQLNSKNDNEPIIVTGDVFIDISKLGHLAYGEKVKLQVINPNSKYSYKWYFDDVMIPGAPESSVLEIDGVTPDQEGKYHVVANGIKASNVLTFTTDFPRTCKEIRDKFPKSHDGGYEINPNGDGKTIWDVQCMMSMHGGGFLAIDFRDAKELFDGSLTAVQQGESSAVRNMTGPRTRDGVGVSTYRYDFTLPYKVKEFTFGDYMIKAYAGVNEDASGARVEDTSDINGDSFEQTRWGRANDNETLGDVSFGSPDNAGPTVSLGSLGYNFSCYNCITEMKVPRVQDLGKRTRKFRIEWGESGPQLEGWEPWYSGHIYLR